MKSSSLERMEITVLEMLGKKVEKNTRPKKGPNPQPSDKASDALSIWLPGRLYYLPLREVFMYVTVYLMNGATSQCCFDNSG